MKKQNHGYFIKSETHHCCLTLFLLFLCSLFCHGQKWSGTGFALGNGYIATNNHVIEGAQTIKVYGINGNKETYYSAKVKHIDAKNDLAIIKITDKNFRGFGKLPYSINNSICPVGESIFVLGYPLTQYMGNEIKLTNGIISSNSGYQDDISTYQISAPIQPGNSGGPLFNEKGNIVGVVCAGIREAENVGYTIKSHYLLELISRSGIQVEMSNSNNFESLNLSKKVSKIKNFVYLIECESNVYNRSVSAKNKAKQTQIIKDAVPTQDEIEEDSLLCSKLPSSFLYKFGNSFIKMVLVNSGYVEYKYLVNNDTIIRSQYVRPYYIADIETTNALWEEVTQLSSRNRLDRYIDYDEDYDVHNNPFVDEKGTKFEEFINDIRDYSDLKFSIPTIAQLQYAAKGGHLSKHYTYSGGNSLNKVAWYRDNSMPPSFPSLHQIKRVRQKRANELGLYDMTGNIDEIGFIDGQYYSFGGHRYSSPEDCKIDATKRKYPFYPRNELIGLRLVIDAKDVDFSNSNIKDNIFITSGGHSVCHTVAYIQETENSTIVCMRLYYPGLRFRKGTYLTASGINYKLIDVPDAEYNNKEKSWKKQSGYIHLFFEKVSDVKSVETIHAGYIPDFDIQLAE